MKDKIIKSSESKILLVDDVPANIEVLRKVLEEEGYTILAAPSGEIALNIVQHTLPDLILLDVLMPEIGGYEVCQQLKNNSLTRHIPIIFVTAKNETDDIVKGFQLGGADYISKPYRQEEVKGRVKSQIQLRGLIKEKENLIKELEEANKKIEHTARTDPLTELANRREMVDKIENEIIRYERNQRPFSLIISDIDFFKNINDRLGHDAGDSILKQLSRFFKSHIRGQDTVARWGGEEFLFLLPETDLHGASILAEKMRKGVASKTHYFNQTEISLTMSFGISLFNNSDTYETCLKRADECLYKAKNSGRNRLFLEDH